MLVVLVVLYSIIGRTIYHHRKRLISHFKKNHNKRELNKYFETISVTSTSNRIENRQTILEEIKRDTPVDQQVANYKVKPFEPHMPSNDSPETISNEFSDVINETNKVKLRNKQDKDVQYKAEHSIVKDLRKSHQFDADTVRVTILMVIVTVIFIGSFLPYLSLSVWASIEGRDEALFLSEAGLVAYHIGLRSYLLNSALNPWIYGIFNRQFRRFYFGWCVRKRG